MNTNCICLQGCRRIQRAGDFGKARRPGRIGRTVCHRRTDKSWRRKKSGRRNGVNLYRFICGWFLSAARRMARGDGWFSRGLCRGRRLFGGRVQRLRADPRNALLVRSRTCLGLSGAVCACGRWLCLLCGLYEATGACIRPFSSQLDRVGFTKGRFACAGALSSAPRTEAAPVESRGSAVIIGIRGVFDRGFHRFRRLCRSDSVLA